MGEDQIEIKNICGSLGIRLISYSPLGLGMLTGKYTPSKLPRGPRYMNSFRLCLIPGKFEGKCKRKKIERKSKKKKKMKENKK